MKGKLGLKVILVLLFLLPLFLFSLHLLSKQGKERAELFYPSFPLEKPRIPVVEKYEELKFTPNNPEYELPLKEIPENYYRDVEERLGLKLSDSQLSTLLSNGVVIVRSGKHNRFEEAYEELSRKNVPVFVTSDSILHLFHIEFNEILKYLEVKELSPMLKEFLKSVLDECIKQYNSFEDEELKELARRNVAYISVALKLLDPEFEEPAFVRSEVEREIKRINEHAGFFKSELMSLDCPNECLPLAFKSDESCNAAIKGGKVFYRGKVYRSEEFYRDVCTRLCYCEDYTQYIPRGHYTENEELKRYFKAMMWLGRITFKLRGYNWTRQAILLTLAVKTANATWKGESIPAYELWKRIYAVTSFFAGVSDDLSFYEYDRALNELFGGFDVRSIGSKEFEVRVSSSSPKAIDLCVDSLGALAMKGYCKVVDKKVEGSNIVCRVRCNSSKIVAEFSEKVMREFKSPKILGGFEIVIAGSLENLTKGMRLLGQRYALDSQILGDLVYKNVGPNVNSPYYEAVIRFCVVNGICSKPYDFYFSCSNMDENKEKYWNEVCDAAVEMFCNGDTCDTEKLYSVCRFMPSGLDVMHALGSAKAGELLRKYLNASSYCGYDEKMLELKKLVKSYTIENWTKNLYNTWLWLLQPLLEEKQEGYPNWMRSEVWKLKSLTTALASWAELRHDTILYVKQSYTWAVGIKATSVVEPGKPLEAKYYAYVEPEPELFSRARYAVSFLKKGLKELNLLDKDLENVLKETEELIERIEKLAKKELEGKELSKEECEFIMHIHKRFKKLLTALGRVTAVEKGDCKGNRCVARESIENEEDAFRTELVADVHTDANAKKVLEVGVGRLDWVLVAHKARDGRIGVAVGPVFSYYEFIWPMSDRLTDEKWRNEVLKEAKPPVFLLEQ